MKLKKKQIEEINNFLQNNDGFYKGDQEMTSDPTINSDRKMFYNLNKISGNAFRGRQSPLSKQGIKDNRPIRNRHFVDSIIYGVLSRMPEIKRPKKINKIYHYTNAFKGINENGLRASNFLNNSNDVNEVTYLLNFLTIEPNQFVDIYNRSIIKRYSSFAYKEIDPLAWTHYLDMHEKTEPNKITTTITDIESKFIKSNSAEFLIHGYVRYDIYGKRVAMKYLNGIISKFWPASALPDYVVEIISILTTFVKRAYSDSSAEDKKFRNYCYKNEMEYRFLFNGINRNGIPYHLLEIDRNWWSNCKEN